jgi:hypothetical protein
MSSQVVEFSGHYKPIPKSKLAGRPRSDGSQPAELSKGYCVYLTSAEANAARDLGNGSLTAGVRRALAMAEGSAIVDALGSAIVDALTMAGEPA